MSNNETSNKEAASPDAKPTTITARERASNGTGKTVITTFDFYDENYERKIKEGLCKVVDMVGDTILSFEKLDTEHVWLKNIDKVTGKTLSNGYARSQLLTVIWLPSAEAAAPDGDGGAFKQGDRVLWIPHNHTGYIAEVDERDGLPCYYLELDMSDETGYAKHESLKLVDESYRVYPREQTEVERLQAENAQLEAALAAVTRERDAQRERLRVVEAANKVLTRFVNGLIRGAALWQKQWQNIQAGDNERELLWDSHERFINYGKEAAEALKQATALATGSPSPESGEAGDSKEVSLSKGETNVRSSILE